MESNVSVANSCLQQLLHKVKDQVALLEWQVWFLFLTSLSLVIFAQRYGIYYEGGDAYGYLENARYMLGQGGFNFFRTPGTSLLFILTGVVIFETWKILMLSYAIMSLLLPLFVYYIIKINAKPTYGLIGGIATLLSGIPFIHSKTLINSDHPFIFFNFLALFLIALFLLKKSDHRYRASLPYVIAIVSFFATLVRPNGAFNFWIFVFLSCVLFYKKIPLKHVLLAALLYISFNVTWTLIDRSHGFDNFADIYAPVNIPERRVGEVYLASNAFHFVENAPEKPAINPANGPASSSLANTLRWYISRFPESLTTTSNAYRPALLFGQYKNNPEMLIHKILYNPTSSYLQFLIEAIHARYENYASDFLITLAKENHNWGLMGVLHYFWKNPKNIFLGGTDTTTMGMRNFLAQAHYTKWREAMNRQWGLTNSPTTLISESNGPYAKEYLRAVQFYLKVYPQYWEPVYKTWAGNPDGLFNSMYHSSVIGEGAESLFFEAVTRYYGTQAGSKLMANTAIEAFLAHPNSLFMFYDNFLFITLNKIKGDVLDAWNYDLLKKWTRGYIRVRNNSLWGLSDGLKSELKTELDEHWFEPFWISNGIFHQVQFIFVIIAVFFTGLALVNRQASLILILWAIYFYNVLSIVFFGAFSSNRYEDVFVLIPVIIACIGSFVFMSSLKNKRNQLG